MKINSRKMIADDLHNNIEGLRRVVTWFNEGGDNTYRLNYDLNPGSLVFDLGGYRGTWTNAIYSKYLCNIYVFEPFIPYANRLKKQFRKNTKVNIYPLGLSGITTVAQLGIDDDASSLFKKGKKKVNIQLIKAESFFKEHDIKQIDLMKINIEGGEYDLLEHLIETGLVVKIKNIQIQFHDFLPDAEARMFYIQNKLRMTHKLTYQYIFVWENWVLK